MRVPFSVARQLVVVLLLCVTGCKPKPGTSILGTTVNGRQVFAEISGSAFISSQDNDAIITTPAHRIVIGSDHVTFDNAEVAKLPAESKKVDVILKEGLLTIQNEGNVVTTKTVDK
jgi:hypothetical protein